MASIISASTTSATALNMSADTTGVLQLATGATPTTAVTIDTSQNVGIGNAIPSSFDPAARNLVIGSGTGNQGTTIYAGSSSAGSIYFANGSSGTNLYKGYIGYIHSSDAMQFATNNSERMRIDSGGAVLMGKTTTDDTNVGFAYRPAGYISVVRSAGAPCYFNRIGTDGVVVEIANDSSTVGTISVSGSSTAYNTSSDYRLKENIVPMTGALDKVSLLKPVTYTWKLDGSNGQGFIAHELAEIVPDAVTGEKDAVDEEGNPKYQGVDTSFLVATLTAAIQEQQTIINDLKARVTALEAK